MTVLAPSLVEAPQDRYTLERELGRGGMATVYLAGYLKHKRYVALKILRPEGGSENITIVVGRAGSNR